MTIAPCRALARFRHREKIAHKRQIGGRLYDILRRKKSRVALFMGQSWSSRVPHVRVEPHRVDADQQWEKAHVAMMGWLGQALAQTRDAWSFITPPPLDDCYRVDRMRGPENYWWNPALGAVGASAFIPPAGSSWGERK